MRIRKSLIIANVANRFVPFAYLVTREAQSWGFLSLSRSSFEGETLPFQIESVASFSWLSEGFL
jgi:hypothetical protein